MKRPAEDPIPNTSSDCANNEEAEKPPKILRTDIAPEKLSDLQTQQSALPNFSVQIVQQFSKTPHSQSPQTIQTNVTVQALNKPLTSPSPQTSSNKPPQEPVSNSKEAHQNNATHPIANIECKQEKDCNQMDLCQFKSTQNSTSDRLSDTFPSLGFTDDSGDDVIHPDLLKDLIDDVFTNSADIMKDFNFDDSVGSLKDHDDATKDIINDLIKESSPIPMRPFQTENLSFVNSSVNQQQQSQPQQPNGEHLFTFFFKLIIFCMFYYVFQRFGMIIMDGSSRLTLFKVLSPYIGKTLNFIMSSGNKLPITKRY